MCNLMTDKKQWLNLPVNVAAGTPVGVREGQVSDTKVPFYKLPKLAAFQIPMSHPDIKSLKLKTPVTMLKTGYSSGLILYDGNGDQARRTKKVMFTESDMVTPLGMTLYAYKMVALSDTKPEEVAAVETQAPADPSK